MKYKKNSVRKGENPKKWVCYVKWVWQKLFCKIKIFFVANGQWLFLPFSQQPRSYVPITFVICSLSHLSHSSPVTTSLVVMVTCTQLFLSQTSILMCNSFLSNWNWWNHTQLVLKNSTMMVRNFTIKIFGEIIHHWIFQFKLGVVSPVSVGQKAVTH